MCNGTPFTVGKISPAGVLEPGTARSPGQSLTHLPARALQMTIMKHVIKPVHYKAVI